MTKYAFAHNTPSSTIWAKHGDLYGEKVTCIKAYRLLTQRSLKQAKEDIERVSWEPITLTIDVIDPDPDSINVLRNRGFIIEKSVTVNTKQYLKQAILQAVDDDDYRAVEQLTQMMLTINE